MAKVDELAGAVTSINNDLNKISEWSRCYGLKVNPSKTQAIIIGGSRMIAKINKNDLPVIVFDGVNLPYSKDVKNLGVVFDSTLSWVPHLSKLSQRIFFTWKSLKRLRNFLPTATKNMLAQSLLLPILDYADTCFIDLTQEQLNKLERLQNMCIRFIFGLRKYDHVSEYREKLKWLPIRQRRNAHVLSLLYSILFNQYSPRYLRERFQFHTPDNMDRSFRSIYHLRLKFPDHRSVSYQSSFTFTAVSLWNALPIEIRSSQSLEIFKRKVKDHYLAQELHRVKANSAFLCNYEVMQLLQQLKENTQKKHKRESSLATVTYETLRFLQETECKNQSTAAIESFMEGLKKIKLTKVEKLMMVNNPPRSELEIQLMVQESEERLSEDDVKYILELVNKTFTVEGS